MLNRQHAARTGGSTDSMQLAPDAPLPQLTPKQIREAGADFNVPSIQGSKQLTGEGAASAVSLRAHAQPSSSCVICNAADLAHGLSPQAQTVQPRVMQSQLHASSAVGTEHSPGPLDVDGKPECEVECLIARAPLVGHVLASNKTFAVKWLRYAETCTKHFTCPRHAPKLVRKYCEQAGIQMLKS